jgi:hypothetical protein
MRASAGIGLCRILLWSGDIVRLEIEAALARGVLVIPILAEGALMPDREDLPESLAMLARRNALPIRHESFRYDAGRLVTAIEQVLSAPSGTVHRPPPAAEPEVSAVPHDVRSGSSPRNETARKDPGAVRNDQARTDLPGTGSVDTPGGAPDLPDCGSL